MIFKGTKVIKEKRPILRLTYEEVHELMSSVGGKEDPGSLLSTFSLSSYCSKAKIDPSWAVDKIMDYFGPTLEVPFKEDSSPYGGLLFIIDDTTTLSNRMIYLLDAIVAQRKKLS